MSKKIMYTNSKDLFLAFNLNDYVHLEEGKNRNKINRTNSTLNEILNIEKNKISTHYNNNSSWDKVKKFSNEYEFIYTSSYANDYKNISNITPVSRSFFKLWEIINNYDDIIPLNTDNLKTAHIAEGPGGFIECIYNCRWSAFDRPVRLAHVVDPQHHVLIRECELCHRTK